MIQTYMTHFLERRDVCKTFLRELIAAGDYPTYLDILKTVIRTLNSDEGIPLKSKLDYCRGEKMLDPDRIQEIDWGDYQGTLLFVVGAEGYQPSDFYTFVVDYGSCSGCDLLQAILYEQEPERKIDLLFDLARNMLSSMHRVEGGLV